MSTKLRQRRKRKTRSKSQLGLTVENRKLQMFHLEQRWLHHPTSRIYEATSALPIEKPENSRDITSSHSIACHVLVCKCDVIAIEWGGIGCGRDLRFLLDLPPIQKSELFTSITLYLSVAWTPLPIIANVSLYIAGVTRMLPVCATYIYTRYIYIYYYTNKFF